MAIIGFTVLALVVVLLLPASTTRISTYIAAEPTASFLWGVLGLILIVPVGLALLVSIVGILLIPVELMFVMLSLVGGFICAGRTIGARLLAAFNKQHVHRAFETLLGLAALWLIGFVPVLGFLLKVVVATIGFGAILRNLIPQRTAS